MTSSGNIITLDEEAQISARRIFSVIANDLAQVELECERQARSNVQVIDYLGEYLRASGGKRVRPALTILSNYAVGGDGSRYNSIRMATVMEFSDLDRLSRRVLARVGRQTCATRAHDSFELCCRGRRLALQLDPHGDSDGVS